MNQKKKTKNNQSYSSQPRFFFPYDLLQLFKPRSFCGAKFFYKKKKIYFDKKKKFKIFLGKTLIITNNLKKFFLIQKSKKFEILLKRVKECNFKKNKKFYFFLKGYFVFPFSIIERIYCSNQFYFSFRKLSFFCFIRIIHNPWIFFWGEIFYAFKINLNSIKNESERILEIFL